MSARDDKYTLVKLADDELRTTRAALVRLYKHETAKMRRMKKSNHPQVAGQAMWMADIKELLVKIHDLCPGVPT
jgi:hypothetical protein